MRLAYFDLHYGSPFMSYTLQAIYPQVDKILILYSPVPSQGYRTTMECPDSRETLLECAKPFRDKIAWIDGIWGNEGDHTNAVFRYKEVEKYEWLIRLNSDEVMPPGMVTEMIRQAEETDAGLFQFPFVHFWQSFNQACRDGQFPYRMVRMNKSQEPKILDSKDGKWTVYHFGYCQPTKFIDYKMKVQAHRPEFRPEWYEEKWLTGDGKDCHIVSRGMWNAEPFDKTKLPEILKSHPFYHMEKVQ